METAIDSNVYLKTILYVHQNIRKLIVEQIADQLLESIIDKLILNPEVRQYEVTQDDVSNAFKSYTWNELTDVFETTLFIDVPDDIDASMLKVVVDTIKDTASTGRKQYPLQSLMTQTSVLPEMGLPAFGDVTAVIVTDVVRDINPDIDFIDSKMVITF